MPQGDRSVRVSTTPDVLSVRFWGVRGSVAVPGPTTVRYGGNTACVEVRWGRDIIILDAGTGIRELGKSLAHELASNKDPHRLSILITHTHWDHIQGFPFFAPAYLAHQRIRILGQQGAGAGLKSTIAAAVESPYFPIALRQMPGTISVEEPRKTHFRLGNVHVRTARIHHPGGGVAFRLDTKAGSLVYVPDHEVPCPESIAQGLASGGSSARAAKAAAAMAQEIRSLIQDADVVVHDAQYSTREYESRVGWGHSSVDAAVQQAAETGVRHLLLFHHDPDRTDDQVDAIQAHARKLAARLNPELVVDAANEGLHLEVRQPRPSRLPKR